jgi:hypothetical protein
MQRPTSRRLQGCPVQSAVLRGFPTLCRRKTWRPDFEPARVAEFPQPAHKARAPNTEQFTACTLRIAPNNGEPFIVLHVCLHGVERIQRRAVRPGSLERQRRSLLIASDYGAGRLGCARAGSLATSACYQSSCRRAIERIARDGNFCRRPASSRVQPETYRYPGEPGGNAYDCASH